MRVGWALFHDVKNRFERWGYSAKLSTPKNLREIMRQANGVILAQKLSRLLSGSRLFRIAAMLVLPFIGVVAAFGIAPDTVTEPVARKQVVQELALPAASLP